jgi:hypothetical protein
MKATIISLCALFALTFRSFGLAGDLTKPALAFPRGFPESAQTNILSALQQTDSRFIGGSFLNSSTTLKYGGDTRALNSFLEGLVKCTGVILSVRFDAESDSEDCDWLVTHSALQPGRFTVHVKLKSSHIKLDDLTIPESKGPPLMTRPGEALMPASIERPGVDAGWRVLFAFQSPRPRAIQAER